MPKILLDLILLSLATTGILYFLGGSEHWTLMDYIILTLATFGLAVGVASLYTVLYYMFSDRS